MGCDIHIVIQAQDPNGVWQEIVYQDTPWQKDKATIPGIPVAPDGFDGRNYDLFGILANVRNGSGFAGIETGSGWPSIAPDRGWPDEFDAEQVALTPEYPEDGPRFMGEHSFTWVSLDELKAFPWDATKSTLYGVVPANEYEVLKKHHAKPRCYSGSVGGPGIETVTAKVWDEGNPPICQRPYVQMSWEETAREATNDWPEQVIPWLESLAAGRPLRLVLGFDS